MPSTPSSNLRLELMASGENDSTWGTKLNVILQLLEEALTKRQSIVLTNSNVTLTTANYASDQARSLCLSLTGVLVANVSLIVPNLSHFYLVENNCTGAFSVTVKTAAGTGVVATQGKLTPVYSNATNVLPFTAESADAQTLDGLDSGEFAQLAAFNQFAKGSGHTFVDLVDGSTVTATLPDSDRFIVTLGGNRTLAFSTPSDGQTFQVWVVQDGTGGRTLTYPANVVFPNNIAPTLNVVGGNFDVLEFTYNQARDQYAAATISTSSVGATLGANEQDVALFARVGSPGGVTTVNLTVQAGTILSASSAENVALDLRGFASGSTINIINNGYILGRGGDGGDGAGCLDQGAGLSGAFVRSADAGQGGGTALMNAGSGITVNIYNASGHIWGGGGGGGGGGTANPAASSNANGGGGGGGAGGGALGRGSKGAGAQVGTDGSRGSAGINGALGAGGAGNGTGATGGAGGAGGDWGADGTAGTQPAPSASNMAAGVAGPAGKAVELNGGAVTFVSGSGSPNVKGAVS